MKLCHILEDLENNKFIHNLKINLKEYLKSPGTFQYLEFFSYQCLEEIVFPKQGIFAPKWALSYNLIWALTKYDQFFYLKNYIIQLLQINKVANNTHTQRKKNEERKKQPKKVLFILP